MSTTGIPWPAILPVLNPDAAVSLSKRERDVYDQARVNTLGADLRATAPGGPCPDTPSDVGLDGCW